ncbi:SRPBCC family protein [Mycolicibacterium sp.]|uniref:SRPBCC family protein n=1 Tax=Mycolicibacterium sp. TaxID=2320850 RepID=UPI001A229035|nr:SRPBCC family protein [Mycolicibacterium sp.]MBJ7339595.1 SRPBCC family protein [Mycolicibacterium sp.]
MLTTARTMAVPPSAAWRVLTDLEAWPQWGPSVTGAELTGPGPLRLGSTGKIFTPFGVPVPFEITEFDDGRSWAWKVLGVPATRHTVATVPDGCRVSFGVPTWATLYLAVCAIALKRIEDLAKA